MLITHARLDHLVYAVPDLDVAIAELDDALGVAPVFGGRHEGFGTHNAVLGLQDGAYLEFLAEDPTQDAPSPFGPFDSARLIGWAAQSRDIDATVAAVRAAGYDPGDPVAMQRTRSDGVLLRWRLTVPGSGSALPFIIDWGDAPHPSDSAPTGVELEAFSITVADVPTAELYLGALGIDVPVRQGPVALSAVLRADGRSVTLR